MGLRLARGGSRCCGVSGVPVRAADTLGIGAGVVVRLPVVRRVENTARACSSGDDAAI